MSSRLSGGHLDWRTPLALRAFGWLLIVLFGGAAVAALVTSTVVSSSDVVGTIFLAAVFAAVAVGYSSIGGVFARITATEAGLVIRNWRRSVTVPWNDITRLAPGYWGIRVQRRSGGSVVARAAQKSNWAAARNKHVRADSIVDELAGVIEQRAGVESAQVQPSSPERADAGRIARRAMLYGTASMAAWTVLRVIVGR